MRVRVCVWVCACTPTNNWHLRQSLFWSRPNCKLKFAMLLLLPSATADTGAFAAAVCSCSSSDFNVQWTVSYGRPKAEGTDHDARCTVLHSIRDSSVAQFNSQRLSTPLHVDFHTACGLCDEAWHCPIKMSGAVRIMRINSLTANSWLLNSTITHCHTQTHVLRHLLKLCASSQLKMCHFNYIVCVYVCLFSTQNIAAKKLARPAWCVVGGLIK